MAIYKQDLSKPTCFTVAIFIVTLSRLFWFFFVVVVLLWFIQTKLSLAL